MWRRITRWIAGKLALLIHQAPQRRPAQPSPARRPRASNAAVLEAVHGRGNARLIDLVTDRMTIGRIWDANLVLQYAPDLVADVAAGRRNLGHAATVARLRRDLPPGEAAAIERRLTGELLGHDGRVLDKAWRQAAKTRAKTDRRFGPRPQTIAARRRRDAFRAEAARAARARRVTLG